MDGQKDRQTPAKQYAPEKRDKQTNPKLCHVKVFGESLPSP